MYVEKHLQALLLQSDWQARSDINVWPSLFQFTKISKLARFRMDLGRIM